MPQMVIALLSETAHPQIVKILSLLPFLLLAKDGQGRLVLKLDLGKIIEAIVVGVMVAMITSWVIQQQNSALMDMKSKVDRIYGDMYTRGQK